jgi:hypothetical protein
MDYTKVEIDVLCDWESPEVYRLFLDGELMSERTYNWPNPQEWLREEITVAIGPGEHLLEITAVNPNFNNFKLTNLTVNKNPVEFKNNKFTI